MSVTLAVGSGLYESPLDTDRIEHKWEEFYKQPDHDMIKDIRDIIGDYKVAHYLTEEFQEQIEKHWAENGENPCEI